MLQNSGISCRDIADACVHQVQACRPDERQRHPGKVPHVAVAHAGYAAELHDTHQSVIRPHHPSAMRSAIVVP